MVIIYHFAVHQRNSCYYTQTPPLLPPPTPYTRGRVGGSSRRGGREFIGYKPVYKFQIINTKIIV